MIRINLLQIHYHFVTFIERSCNKEEFSLEPGLLISVAVHQVGSSVQTIMEGDRCQLLEVSIVAEVNSVFATELVKVKFVIRGERGWHFVEVDSNWNFSLECVEFVPQFS